MSGALLRRRDRPSAARRGALWPGAFVALFLSFVLPGIATGTPSSAGSTLPAFATAVPSDLVWSTLAPAASPPPLRYASAVYDSDNHTIVLFGGISSQGAVSDSTWVWNGTTWTDFSPTQIVEPPARYSASIAFDPALHQLILFGGRGAGGHELDDTWAWNGGSWYNVNVRDSVSPSARDGAAFAYDGQGHLLLFGGEGPAGTGGLLSPSSASSQSSQGHSLDDGLPTAISPSQSTLAPLGDTWEWRGTGWSPAANSGPPARVNAAAAYDSANATIVLYGGTPTPNGSPTTTEFGDTWAWNGSGWTQAAPVGGPPARSAAVLADFPLAGGLVLFGGDSGSAPTGDTWLWNGSSWTQPSIAGAPVARSGAVGAFDAAAGQVVVFGGAGPSGGLLGSTLVFSEGLPVSLGPATTGPTVTPRRGSSSTGSTVPSAALSNPPVASAPQRSRAVAGGSRSSDKSLPVLRRGQLVTLHGSSFSPGAKVTITFHSTPVVVGNASAGPHGDFVATVAVPENAPGGTHRFEASGITPRGQATVMLATFTVTVPHSSRRPSLAATLSLVAVAFILPLGTWLLLGLRGRVRHRIA